MADVFTKRRRSEIMRAVKSSGMKPELVVRRALRGMGAQSNVKTMPGTPDVVVPASGTAVMVHGCFWHRHVCRAGRSVPKTNRAFWVLKFKRNRARDARVRRELRLSGWKVIEVWECQLRKKSRERTLNRLKARLRRV